MIWFNKQHPNVLYVDKFPREKGCIEQQKNFEVAPDEIVDFTKMPYPDKSFKLVVFDPPHAFINKGSIIGKKYGGLGDDWKEELSGGFSECWRVLEDFGVLIFKWSEVHVSLKEISELFPAEPLFGHTTAKSGKTKWVCFMKIPLPEYPRE